MTVEEELFLEQILEERDRLFRESSRLKSQLSAYVNFDSERASFEAKLQEKDKTIGKLTQEKEKLTQEKEKLAQRIQMLLRKIWGKSSERFVKEDPAQRCLDFEGLDLLPEEKALATSAK